LTGLMLPETPSLLSTPHSARPRHEQPLATPGRQPITTPGRPSHEHIVTTPGRHYLLEGNPPQPDHPFPVLDLPAKNKQRHGSSSEFACGGESSYMEKVMQANFARIHCRHDEMVRRLLQSEMKIQLVLDKIADCLAVMRLAEGQPTVSPKVMCEPVEQKDIEMVEAIPMPDFTSKRSLFKAFKSRTFSSSSSQKKRDQAAKQLRQSRSSETLGSRSSGSAVYTSGARVMHQLAEIIATHARSSTKNRRARAIWHFFENRNSGCWAFLYGSYFMPLVIFASVCLPFLQTADDLSMPSTTFSYTQVGFESFFLGEFILRLAVSPDRFDFCFSLLNWIDFFSAVPVFVRIYLLIVDAENSLAILSLVPILRLLKIVRRFHKFSLLKEAIHLAIEALPVLVYAMILIAMMFAGLIYFVEPRSHIESLPHALWFVVITMTTVGYGDVVPSTPSGRICAVILMVVSVLYMAMPIGIVGNAFSQVWGDRDRLLLIAALRENFALSGISPALCHDLFLVFTDNDDTNDLASDDSAKVNLNLDQFHKMMMSFKINVSDERIAALFRSIDTDGGGSISTDEFMQLLFSNHGFGLQSLQRIRSSLAGSFDETGSICSSVYQ